MIALYKMEAHTLPGVGFPVIAPTSLPSWMIGLPDTSDFVMDNIFQVQNSHTPPYMAVPMLDLAAKNQRQFRFFVIKVTCFYEA